MRRTTRHQPMTTTGQHLTSQSSSRTPKISNRTTLLWLALATVIALHTAAVHAQTPDPVTDPVADQAQSSRDETIQRLERQLEDIQQQLTDLKHQVSAAQPAAAAPATPTFSPKASAPVSPAVTAQPAGEGVVGAVQTPATDPNSPHSDPFSFADFTWLNGNARTEDTPYATKFFTPEIRADVNYTYDFRHPSDDTISGSSEVFRSNEVQVTQLGVGGDFHYDNVRARVLTQFGLYSETTPRNDASPARGQWNLADAYRYLSEAYGGYHFNVQHGINVDAGIFMSYVGLFSYYQFDNWAYQPSYVSSNTPWFFNGVRVQWFPTAKLKIEPWFINGWQSYGRFNNRPGLGGQVLYRPNGKLSILGNQYGYGRDALGVGQRTRYHTDDSVEYKYFDRPTSTVSKAALTPHRRRRLRDRRRRKLLRHRQKWSQAELSRLHGLQPPLVQSRQICRHRRRRKD